MYVPCKTKGIHVARRTSKSIKLVMMEKKLVRCNPFNEKDVDIENAKLKRMPNNSGFIYKKLWNLYIKDIDEMSMENWATGDSGKHKFPELEVACLMVHTQMYMIPFLRAEGELEEDILEVVKEMGFSEAKLKFNDLV